jgi:hypothetical protein
MKYIFLFACMIIAATLVKAQDSLTLINLNQEIDSRVVKRDTVWLHTKYGNDFVFSHGSGKVEGRNSWLSSVIRSNFVQRQHDSVKAELHANIAVLKGKMDIKKVNKEKTDSYHLRYIRVYALRKDGWELISHNTTHEWHDQ